jgi:hypothetical protein
MNFVIVSSTRTGSTMLDSAFKNCKNISSFGECISFRKLNEYFFTNHPDKTILDIRKYDNKHSLYSWYINTHKNPKQNIKDEIHNLAEDWLNWLYSLDKSVCYKLLWNNAGLYNKCFVDYINKNQIKVLYLSRNPVNRVKSMKNKFLHLKNVSNEELIKETLKEQEDLKNWFPNRLNITFEELTNDKDTTEFPYEITKKIFDYLELEYQTLKPMIKRTKY